MVVGRLSDEEEIGENGQKIKSEVRWGCQVPVGPVCCIQVGVYCTYLSLGSPLVLFCFALLLWEISWVESKQDDE